MTTIENLDEAVGDYLHYRKYNNTLNQFNLERTMNPPEEEISRQEKEVIIGRIMNAILASDYPKSLSLWDSYIVQHIEK